MKKTYPVISERTYAEWPEDHPGKRLPVIPDEAAQSADCVVCTIKGEPRIAAGPDDPDFETDCAMCGVTVVHRFTAPPLPKWCWKCFMGAS